MLELVFTSAKEGLIPGRSGFCSVAWTEGMPQNFVALLENMSGYNALYMPNDSKADLNPVCYSYQKVQYGQNELRILSRIAFAGLDYTGRTNKIAHHIIIEDESELANLQHGPVSAFLCEENFITAWNEPPRLIPRRTRLKSAFTDGLRADQWLGLTGKPQWAGIVADSFLNSDEKSCLYLEYNNEAHRKNVLYLVDEIARLLPQDAVADFTFNTYFSNVQNGINCFFRAALPNCPALPAIKRFKAKDLISLINQTEPPRGNNSPLITAAVTGVAPVVEEKVVASQSDVYSQQMLELQQMRMQQQTQPPAKKIVYKGKNNNIERQESSHSQVGNSMSPRIRLLLFTSGSLMLMILIGFGVWVTQELTAEPMEDSAPAQAETPTTPETAQENDNKAEGNKEKQEPAMEQAQEKKPQADGPAPTPPKQDIAEKKITEAPTPPKVAQKNQNIKLETKDLYDLFKGFVALEKKRTTTIPLPDVLKQTERFEVKINSWNKNVENSKIENFVKRESLCFVACDIKNDPDKGYYADENTVLLNISLRDNKNKLSISGEHMEEVLKCIESITFYTPTGKCTWSIRWEDEFLAEIKNGSFNESFIYKMSDDEQIFSDFLEFKGKNQTAQKRKIEQDWRNYHEKEQVLKEQKEKLAKKEQEEENWKKTKQLYEEIIKELQKEKPDLEKQVKKKFNQYYEIACSVPNSYFKTEFAKRKKPFDESLKKYNAAKKALDDCKSPHDGRKSKQKKLDKAKSELTENAKHNLNLEEKLKAAGGERQYFFDEINALWKKKATSDQAKKNYEKTYNRTINKSNDNNKDVHGISDSLEDIKKKIRSLESELQKKPDELKDVQKSLKVERTHSGKSR